MDAALGRHKTNVHFSVELSNPRPLRNPEGSMINIIFQI